MTCCRNEQSWLASTTSPLMTSAAPLWATCSMPAPISPRCRKWLAMPARRRPAATIGVASGPSTRRLHCYMCRTKDERTRGIMRAIEFSKTRYARIDLETLIRLERRAFSSLQACTPKSKVLLHSCSPISRSGWPVILTNLAGFRHNHENLGTEQERIWPFFCLVMRYLK